MSTRASDDKHLENRGCHAPEAEPVTKESYIAMKTDRKARLHRIVALLGAVVLVTALSTGCGGDGGAGEVEPSGSETETGFLFVQEAAGGTSPPWLMILTALLWKGLVP